MFLGVAVMIPRMDDNGLDWTRAGEALKAARERAFSSQKAAADHADMGTTTWRNLEHGRAVKSRNITRAEAAVGWPLGTLRRIAEGEDPPSSPGPAATTEDVTDWLMTARDAIDRALNRLQQVR